MGKAAHLRGVRRLPEKPGQRPPSPGARGSRRSPRSAGSTGRNPRTSGSSTAGRPARCTGCPPSGPGTCWGLLRPGNPAAWRCPCCRSRPSPSRRRSCPGCWRPWGELSQEDPLLDLEWVPESQEMLLRVTGNIQLEVLAEVIGAAVRPGCLLLQAHSPVQGDAPNHRGGRGGLPGPQALLGHRNAAGGAPPPGAAASSLSRSSRRRSCPTGTRTTCGKACLRP